MRAEHTVVVGAGPAGLSAAHTLATRGIACTVLEQGGEARARDRQRPADLLAGVGGAGLFSDGKHSFFPSATQLRRLPGPQLQQAFADTAALLRDVTALDVPPFPEVPGAPTLEFGRWVEKPYPSLYLSFAKRLALIHALASPLTALKTGTRVESIARTAEGFDVKTSNGVFEAGHLILAGGRWSSAAFAPWLTALGATQAFQRIELGVRIEAPADNPAFAKLPGVDGKLKRIAGAGIELRTFCTCRQGEVVLGEAFGRRAYSGRADGPATERSNVGLVLRVLEPNLGRRLFGDLRDAPANFPLTACLEKGPALLEPIFGVEGAMRVFEALEAFLEHLPELKQPETTLHAPCLEGVGDYPVDDGTLKVAPNVWVAGDGLGRFRGIVASLVSGRYAALQRLRNDVTSASA